MATRNFRRRSTRNCATQFFDDYAARQVAKKRSAPTQSYHANSMVSWALSCAAHALRR
jgi:hypothetical protein